MKKLNILIGALLLSIGTMGQTAEDALRFSMQNYTGTARSAAMGGAFGALGGDFSSLSINPAGISVYRSSEFTFTPSIEMTKSESGNLSENKYSFTIGNIGYVATFKPRFENKSGWKNFNLGLGYNRVNNFNRNQMIQNFNASNSQLDVWANFASGLTPNDLYIFEDKLAFDTYLLNVDENLDYFAALDPTDQMNQMKNISEKGYMGEYLVSFGANYDNKLYLGATVGIQDLYYKQTTTYTETAVAGNVSSLQNYTFREYLKTSGVGVNFKFGAIFKPIEELRLGIAVHTPTFFDLNNTYETSMESNFDPNNPAFFPTDDEGNPVAANHSLLSEEISEPNYDFETPFRAIFSAAYLFGKKGLVSVDYEIVDYSDAKLSNGSGGETFYGTPEQPKANDVIKASYTSTQNIRIGAEYRLSSYISLRAGYAHFGSAYKSGVLNRNVAHDNYSLGWNQLPSYNTYSVGWGVKRNNVFFDMAYLYSDKDENYFLYNHPDVRARKIENQNHQVRMTLGFKF